MLLPLVDRRGRTIDFSVWQCRCILELFAFHCVIPGSKYNSLKEKSAVDLHYSCMDNAALQYLNTPDKMQTDIDSVTARFKKVCWYCDQLSYLYRNNVYQRTQATTNYVPQDWEIQKCTDKRGHGWNLRVGWHEHLAIDWKLHSTRSPFHISWTMFKRLWTTDYGWLSRHTFHSVEPQSTLNRQRANATIEKK